MKSGSPLGVPEQARRNASDSVTDSHQLQPGSGTPGTESDSEALQPGGTPLSLIAVP